MSQRHPDFFAAASLGLFVVLFTLAFLGMLPPGLGTLALLLSGIALYYLITGLHARGASESGRSEEKPEVPSLAPPTIWFDDLFQSTERRRTGAGEVVRGRLLLPPEVAAEQLAKRLKGSGWVAVLEEEPGQGHRVVLVPGERAGMPPARRRTWLHVLLLALTFLTTTWAGAAHHGASILREPGRLAEGIPYSVALLLILGAHELGHYFAARRHGMNVSLPYFVPIPFGLGTFGAFIQLRSPSPSRRALFDMAVAGPLAGLALAAPALLVGLPLSRAIAPSSSGDPVAAGMSIGSSMLLTLLGKLSIGPTLSETHLLQLHPLAFAGWLGLILTALNLLPIGQLDGGHIADAMLGRHRSALVGTLALVTIFGLAIFVWSGLLFWAFIVYFVAGRKGLPPLDNITPLDTGRRALGVLALVLLLAILLPVPHALFRSLGIHCPYL